MEYLNPLNKRKQLLILHLRSSIIANAVKKTFNDIGTLEPNKDNIPKENAISVADGIAQPFIVSEFPQFIKT